MILVCFHFHRHGKYLWKCQLANGKYESLTWKKCAARDVAAAINLDIIEPRLCVVFDLSVKIDKTAEVIASVVTNFTAQPF